MSKKAKATKVVAPLITAAPVALATAAPVALATAAPAVPAKLTKRNSTPTTATLVATDKAPKSRADHVKAAWDAILKALPNTAAELAKLPPLADPKCVSPSAFISYMQRRGFLTVKA